VRFGGGKPRAQKRRMTGRSVLLLALAATLGVTAQRKAGPHVPPPRETNAYEVLALGAPPVVACTCIPNPFALPTYRPGWGYGNGPGVPFDPAPITDVDHRRNREWYVEEEQHLRRVSVEALAGNPNASLAMATHFSMRQAIFGPDDRVEHEAVRWLTLAAQQGHADAFRMLGHRYATGSGVTQDYAAAAQWFDYGARLNDPLSMTAIGFLRAAGRGASQDWAVALRWWQYAERRTPIAARFLGDVYACGAGVPEDRAQALALYTRAAEVDPSAAIQIGYMHVRGCSPDNDAAAVTAFTRAASRGFPDAQIELSDLLLRGGGGEPDPMWAYYWARLAERRLPAGALKARAAKHATAAAGMLSALQIATQDEMVTTVLTSAAHPVR
jgi:TPR repeat protein